MTNPTSTAVLATPCYKPSNLSNNVTSLVWQYRLLHEAAEPYLKERFYLWQQHKEYARQLSLTHIDDKPENTAGYWELRQIRRLVMNLVHRVLQQYNVYRDLSPVISDQIRENCVSLILLKAVQTFDFTKETVFSTHYTWLLRSHIRCEYNNYMRRQVINDGVSLNHSKYVGDTNTALVEDTVSNMHIRTMSRFKRSYVDLLEGNNDSFIQKGNVTMRIRKYRPTAEDTQEELEIEKEKTELTSRMIQATTRCVTKDVQVISQYRQNIQKIAKLAPSSGFTPKSRNIKDMIREQEEFLTSLNCKGI